MLYIPPPQLVFEGVGGTGKRITMSIYSSVCTVLYLLQAPCQLSQYVISLFF